ncbi:MULTISPECIES: hypothetical protein [unclassified Polaribacter]|uniref:hypothetical protein n=1 Tax=unclassified Polaribacter TaxID=196858 RepID=UPI0011BEE8EE|nr:MULTISPECIES: hypothetical protein [unclassified Polaribacter]TXD53597.1 hypothetical protein ES043_02940 [Polaribacter sp. IC063]TXD62162.1 hypothetical protein ES044_02765 [Polaribacter sp. IC066]
MPTDFRLIKPIKRFSDYYQKNFYVVPCEILEMLGERRFNGEYVKLKVLNPNSGDLIFVKGLIYDKTLEMIKELGALELPFLTQCCIYKGCNIYNGNENFDLIVYGMFNADILERIFGIDEDGFLTDEQMNEVFNNHYKDLIEWFNS